MSDEHEGLARRLVIGHKSDGRKVFDERVKAEVVALAISDGTSVSRLARQLDINANQLSRWIREQRQLGQRGAALETIASGRPAFLPVEIQTPAPSATCSTLSIQVRMPNGVALEFTGCELPQARELIEMLGRLPCSGLTTR